MKNEEICFRWLAIHTQNFNTERDANCLFFKAFRSETLHFKPSEIVYTWATLLFSFRPPIETSFIEILPPFIKEVPDAEHFLSSSPFENILYLFLILLKDF